MKKAANQKRFRCALRAAVFFGRGVFACGCGRGVGRVFARCGRRFARRRRRRAFAPFVRRCARTRSAGRQSGAGAIARDDAQRSRSPPFGNRRLRARAGLARKRRRFDQSVIGARRPRLGVSQIRSRRLRDSFAGSLPRRNESPRRSARLVAQSESDSAELLASPSSRAEPLVFSALRGVTARRNLLSQMPAQLRDVAARSRFAGHADVGEKKNR